jgi:hypothetical protein
VCLFKALAQPECVPAIPEAHRRRGGLCRDGGPDAAGSTTEFRQQPDGEDLDDRADTLRVHIRAFQSYLRAFMADCANASWHVELANVFTDGLFEDLVGDCCGCLKKAADRARESTSWRAA